MEAIEVALRVARATRALVDPTVGGAMRAIGYDRDFALVTRKKRTRRSAAAAEVGGWREIRMDRRARTVQLPSGVELDLGATAKALAADRASRRVHEAIGGGVLVSLGGDLAIAGEPPSGGWLVQVADDHAAAVPSGKQNIRVIGGGLATSSTTVRRWTMADGCSSPHR